ncbi:MAG: hypothetical protein A2113_00700 [Candidatus Woykebacteria bacterium GWA1_44_8]|uniref:Phosphatidic acid phosphatase type 2/haloperoxidase domain-containing protein n=1 Tax=Candidatus Woykebacteria bacterium GWA1_44_8 TaxID=1802591 RepID=A0A1G1W2H5_9BACT|nr:MAG: hypothetical protein A2113_00700 [Candidatus Woykebacteria bacterium GWA1_44_8]
MNLISLDKDLFLFINGWVGKLPWCDNLIKLVVNEYFVPATLSLILLYLWFAPSKNQTKQQEAILTAFFSIVVLAILIVLSNQFIVRERPFAQLPTHLLFYRPTDPSFPSNAAAVGLSLATAIFLVTQRLGTTAILLAVFYAFSRVYAGVHFPSDVIAGAILGVLITLLVSRFTSLMKFSTDIARKVQKRLQLNLDT